MKQSIKPFADQGHYTEAHNLLFDYIMPRISANAFKVLCLILRRTKGWGKASDAISYAQIKDGTGIKSDATISRAIGELLEMNCILNKANPTQRVTSRYALNRGYTIPTSELYSDTFTTSKNEVVAPEKSPATSKNEVTTTSKNEVVVESGTTSKNEDTKENKTSTNQSNSTVSAVQQQPPKTDLKFSEELQAAILEATGKTTDWRMGTVSPKFRMGVTQLVAKLVRDERTARDVQVVRARLPAYLGRDPAGFTPPSPAQLLDLFDAVLNFDPDQITRNKKQHHGNHPSNPAGRNAAQRGEQTREYLDDLSRRRAAIEERKRKLGVG
jgi:phage replication O-like protein O